MLEQEYYVPLYRLASAKLIAEDKRIASITEWLIQHSRNIDLKKVKASFKRANREDLSEYFIEDTDVKIGDRVRSRTTGRFGKVTEQNWDMDSVIVSWDEGGKQLISKGMLQKMSEVDEKGIKPSDFKNVKRMFDPYKNMLDSSKTDISK